MNFTVEHNTFVVMACYRTEVTENWSWDSLLCSSWKYCSQNFQSWPCTKVNSLGRSGVFHPTVENVMQIKNSFSTCQKIEKQILRLHPYKITSIGSCCHQNMDTIGSIVPSLKISRTTWHIWRLLFTEEAIHKVTEY